MCDNIILYLNNYANLVKCVIFSKDGYISFIENDNIKLTFDILTNNKKDIIDLCKYFLEDSQIIVE